MRLLHPEGQNVSRWTSNLNIYWYWICALHALIKVKTENISKYACDTH